MDSTRTRGSVLLALLFFSGCTVRSGTSLAITNSNSNTNTNTINNTNNNNNAKPRQRSATALSAAPLDALRTAFPEDAGIVEAGGWHNLEKLAEDPKGALVGFVVDGLGGGSSAVRPGAAASVATGEKLAALSLLLYGTGKGFSADAVDGEWDLVFAREGRRSPSFQKIVGSREKAGLSKSVFDVRSMVFRGDVRFWKWGRVSTTVEYTPTSESFSKCPSGKIVVRKIVCQIVNAFFKWWKLPGIPFPLPKKKGFLEFVYLDEDIRVTKGNRGGFFVHFRPDYLQKVLAARGWQQ